MTWIGLRDNKGSMLFNPQGLVRPNSPIQPANDFLPQGTLVLEFLNEPGAIHRNLIRFSTREPEHNSFRLSIDEDGSIHLMMSKDHYSIHHVLPTDLSYVSGPTILWFTWDIMVRSGTLAVQTAHQQLFQADLSLVYSLALQDVNRMCTHKAQTSIDESVAFLAFANQKEPIGPWARMGSETHIETPKGLVPISKIHAGDLVLTADNEITQVRWAGWQVLPARGRFRPLIIRTPYFGATNDIVMAQTQFIEIGGSKVEYLMGHETVLAEIGHIVDGYRILQCNSGPLALYYDILLDRQSVLNVGGVRMTSFDSSGLVENPSTLRKSILKNVPTALLPKPIAFSSPKLKKFEAINVCL